MIEIMKRIIGILLVLCCLTPTYGQKALKTLRSYVKAKNTTEALKQLEKLEKDSVAGGLPQLYDLGKQVQMLLNDAENEKIYLKQAYDTASFFKTTGGIYDYILKCESQEQRLLAEEGKKMKFHKENGEILHRYYDNLSAGGRYFFSRKNYADAMSLLKMYLDIPQQPVWGADKSVTRTRVYVNNAYLYQKSAYLNKNYDEVGRYKDITLNDTSIQRRMALEYMVLTAEVKSDTTNYRKYLENGVEEYPADAFFFTRLVDYFAGRKDYDKVYELSEEALEKDSTDVVALEAQSLALMNKRQDDEAIAVAKKCLKVDSTLVDAYYYVGAAYCNLALDVNVPVNINTKAYRKAVAEQKGYYASAQPYMEKYRQLAPEEKERWAPLLYRIYFSLNLGSEFEEIEKITQTIKTQ